MPKVSVLIPVYNREALVARAIEAAQSQTHANLEIIVSDNASTDEHVGGRQPARGGRFADPAAPQRIQSRTDPQLDSRAGRVPGRFRKDPVVRRLAGTNMHRGLATADGGRSEVGMAFSSVIVHYADRDVPMHHFQERTDFTSAEYLAEAPCSAGKRPFRPVARSCGGNWPTSGCQSATTLNSIESPSGLAQDPICFSCSKPQSAQHELPMCRSFSLTSAQASRASLSIIRAMCRRAIVECESGLPGKCRIALIWLASKSA